MHEEEVENLNADINENDNQNTNWFIKTNNVSDKLIAKLNKIKYNIKNNVGAYSISKQDIINKYNKIFFEDDISFLTLPIELKSLK